MMADKPMTTKERINKIQDEIIKCQYNLEEVKKFGGNSCYAAGFEEGLLCALIDELEYLEGWKKSE